MGKKKRKAPKHIDVLAEDVRDFGRVLGWFFTFLFGSALAVGVLGGLAHIVKGSLPIVFALPVLIILMMGAILIVMTIASYAARSLLNDWE